MGLGRRARSVRFERARVYHYPKPHRILREITRDADRTTKPESFGRVLCRFGFIRQEPVL